MARDPWKPTDLDKAVMWGQQYDLFQSAKARSLLRAYELGAAGPEIEAMIMGMVRPLKRLEVEGRLEPFPTPGSLSGNLSLGVLRNDRSARIAADATTQGMLILGASGSGKTTLLTQLLLQIAGLGAAIWVTDMYKTHLRHLAPLFGSQGNQLLVLRRGDWRVNLLQPSVEDPRTHMALCVDLLIRRLGLPPRARTILRSGLYALYDRFGVWSGRTEAYPCLWDLLVWVQSTEGLHVAAREAILDRLIALLLELTPECGALRVGWTTADLMPHSIDFEMAGTSDTLKQLLLEPLLFSVMQRQIESRRFNVPLQLFVAFEDAQRFMSEQSGAATGVTPLPELAGVCRSSGLGLCFVVQTMDRFPRGLTANLATKIMGRTGIAEDPARLGADMGMTQDQITWHRRRLRRGQFVVQLGEGDYREPMLVTVPFLRTPPVVTDSDAKRSLGVLSGIKVEPALEFARWRPGETIRVERPPTQRLDSSRYSGSASPEPDEATAVEPVPKDLLDYLEAWTRSPFDTATERDAALSLSAWKGNKLRRDLVGRGLVREVPINPGGRGKRFKLLELTPEGRELLKALRIPVPKGHGRGGAKHRYWVAVVSRLLDAQGLANTIEDDARGARVDLSASFEGKEVAIEVETSAGHELENIRTDLTAGYCYVITLVERQEDVDRIEELLRAEVDAVAALVTVGRLVDFAEVVPATLLSLGFGLRIRPEA